MKASKLLVPLLILGLALPTSVGSSDFSKLAEPGFARSMMISPERQIEVQCAALAFLPYRKLEFYDAGEKSVHIDEPTDEMIAEAEEDLSVPPYSEKLVVSKNGQQPVDTTMPAENISAPFMVEPEAEPVPEIVFEKLLPEEQAEKLQAAVLTRLKSDIGDDEWALGTIELWSNSFAPQWDFSEENVAEKKAHREASAQTCQSIFYAARAGELEVRLSPPSAELIPLMDIDTCLAYDLIAKKSPDYATYSILADNRGDDTYTSLVGSNGPGRKAREKKIAAVAANLGPVDPQIAVTKLFPCLATYVIEMKKNPEFWEATE